MSKSNPLRDFFISKKNRGKYVLTKIIDGVKVYHVGFGMFDADRTLAITYAANSSVFFNLPTEQKKELA